MDFFDFVILVFALSNGRECKCKTAKVHSDRQIKGAKVPENENSRELLFPEAKRPGSESATNELARERGQGAKVPGSKSARVLLADSLQGGVRRNIASDESD